MVVVVEVGFDVDGGGGGGEVRICDVNQPNLVDVELVRHDLHLHVHVRGARPVVAHAKPHVYGEPVLDVRGLHEPAHTVTGLRDRTSGAARSANTVLAG